MRIEPDGLNQNRLVDLLRDNYLLEGHIERVREVLAARRRAANG
jgi:DNA-binding transcriptional MocR family regulator